MPFCQISSDVCLHYITNAPGDDIANFDPAKPTILFLHPVAFDVSWLRLQFQDPRLNDSYNLIAFDSRNLGKTRSAYTPYRDSYVDAADLGFAFELLQLPPVHVFAIQVNSVWTAARFVLLFPSNCLSVCFASCPVDVPVERIAKANADLVEIWCYPQDLETFEQAALEMIYFQFSGQVTSEMEDEVVAWWQMNLPPRKRRTVLEVTFGRCPPTDEEYARIRIPTLMMTGDRSLAHPVEEVIKTHEKMPGSQLYVVKGAPETFPLLPQYSGIVHRVYCDFLSRQTPPPKFIPRKPDVPKVAKDALARLADIRGDPSIAFREPASSLAFSMWPPEVVTQHQTLLDQMALDEDKAFSPLNAQGHPIRKFSQRHDDQWTSAGFDRIQDSMKAIQGIQFNNLT